MTGSTWNRDLATTRLRPVLWRYLSGAATYESAGASLPRMPLLSRPDFIRIFAIHLALRTDTTAALAAAERALRELPPRQTNQVVELRGEVRGPVSWSLTQRRQVAESDPTLFVCTPPERRYDTPLGRLVLTALRCASELAGLTGLTDGGAVGQRVHEVSRTARRLLLHPKLTRVRRTGLHALRHSEVLVGRRPYLNSLVDLVTDYFAGVVQGDQATLQDMLENAFLAPQADSTLFELQIGFDVLDALQQMGYRLRGPQPLLPAGNVPFASLYGPSGMASLWWQRSIWTLMSDGDTRSRWADVLTGNGLSRQALRPDFILDIPHAHRRLMIEVKLTALENGTPERDGLRDVMAYLRDASDIIDSYRPPYAFVAAWNAKGRPVDPSESVQVSNQDSVASILIEALRDRVLAWTAEPTTDQR